MGAPVESAFGYIAVDGHRLWRDARKCNHSNENACAFCDFDGYYANRYDCAPWRTDDLETTR